MSQPFEGTLQDRIVTLGQVVRGLRLGFHWCSVLQAMVRIQPEGNHFTVTMCAPDCIPSGTSKIPHYAWWEEQPDLLGMSRAIVERANPPGIVQFAIDDNGEELRAR